MGSSAIWRLVKQGEHAPFEVSGDTIVGRSRKADLYLGEGFVSRRHARLWVEAGRLMVEDLGSANGTFVNGKRLSQPMRLAPGDCVMFDVFEYWVEAIAPSLPGDPNAIVFKAPVNDADAEIEDFTDSEATGPALLDSQPAASRDAFTTPPVTAVEVEQSLPSLDDPEFDLDIEEDNDWDFDLTGESATLPPWPEQDRHGVSRQVSPPPPRPSPPAHAPDKAWTPVLAATVDMGSGESPSLPQTPMTASAEHPAQGVGQAAAASAPALLAISGPLEGSLIHLEPGRILLGRGVDCDIWIDHPAVSLQHLEISLSKGRCRVRQMDGAHGALLNGNPLGDAELIPGDILRLGSVEFFYDSIQRLTQSDSGLAPWVWMLVGFLGAGAILTGLFMFVL